MSESRRRQGPSPGHAPQAPQGFGVDARRRRALRRGAVLRAVEAQPRLGAERAEEAAGDRPDDGHERPVRRLGRRRAARRDDGDQGVQREGRRARPVDRGDPHGHRDHAGHRHAHRRADDHPQRSRLPDRRGALGRGQRDLAGGAEVRLRLPQHQLELAHRGRQGLPPGQVRLGRQRQQLLARDRQERDAGERQELAAPDQRLRLGPHHLEGDAGDHRGQRRQGRRRAAGAAEHPRLRRLPAEDPADQAGRGRHRGRRRRHQGAAPAGGAAEDEQEPGLDQQPAGLARHLRPRAGRDLRRVRHQLVLAARPAGRQGVRRRLPEAVPGDRDPHAGQRLLQRLHGDARAAEGGGARRHDQQPGGDPGAGEPQGLGPRPDAALRRLHEPGDAPAAADDLHGELQRQPGGEGRHLPDPRPGAAAGRGGQGRDRAPASSSRWRRRRATSSELAPRPAAPSR